MEQGLHLRFCQLAVYTFGDQKQSQLRVCAVWWETVSSGVCYSTRFYYRGKANHVISQNLGDLKAIEFNRLRLSIID